MTSLVPSPDVSDQSRVLLVTVGIEAMPGDSLILLQEVVALAVREATQPRQLFVSSTSVTDEPIVRAMESAVVEGSKLIDGARWASLRPPEGG